MTKNQDRQDIIKFTAQLDKIVSTKDGGTKITLDCGYDAIEAIQELQRLNGVGGINLAVAIAPFGSEITI